MAGLAPEQFLMEQFCYVINIYYNLSIKAEFWTWGEVVFLFAGNVVLLEQVVAYGGAETKWCHHHRWITILTAVVYGLI